jgi:hypothetical protein
LRIAPVFGSFSAKTTAFIKSLNMGMFTSVIDPIDGTEHQIKCGYDDCDTYHVGDSVDWYINKSCPRSGKLLDDVYDSYDGMWVVIKDHVVVAVLPESYGDYNSIKEKFQVQDLPDSEWPEESWIKSRELEEKRKKEYDEYLQSISHLSGKEHFAAILAYPMIRELSHESIGRKIFSIE